MDYTVGHNQTNNSLSVELLIISHIIFICCICTLYHFTIEMSLILLVICLRWGGG